jgi:hypothetical protein
MLSRTVAISARRPSAPCAAPPSQRVMMAIRYRSRFGSSLGAKRATLRHTRDNRDRQFLPSVAHAGGGAQH